MLSKSSVPTVCLSGIEVSVQYRDLEYEYGLLKLGRLFMEYYKWYVYLFRIPLTFWKRYPFTYLIKNTASLFKGPSYPRKQSLTVLPSVYMWTVLPVGRVCMIFHNPFCIIKCVNIPLSLRFPRLFDQSGYGELIFSLGIRWHSPSRELSRLGEPWRNVLPLARVTLSAGTRQIAHPSRFAPFLTRTVRDPNKRYHDLDNSKRGGGGLGIISGYSFENI